MARSSETIPYLRQCAQVWAMSHNDGQSIADIAKSLDLTLDATRRMVTRGAHLQGDVIEEWDANSIVAHVPLSVKAAGALRSLRLVTVGDVARITEEEWTALPNVGPKTRLEIKTMLLRAKRRR